VSTLRPAVEALPLAATPVPPPPALRTRIMGSVASEAELLQAAGESADRPPRDRRRRPLFEWLRPGLAAGLAAAAVAVGALGYLIGEGTEPSARSVAADVTFGHASATVRTKGDQAELRLTGMPAPPPGKVYEVWLEHDGQMPRPAGALFLVRSGAVTIPGGLKGASRVLVTAEPSGGSLVPTSRPVIVADTA
jgi:anti-sigma-K factor RskA